MILEWDTYTFINEHDSHHSYEFNIQDIEYLGIFENSGSGYCEIGIEFNTVNKKLNIRYTEGAKESFVSHFDISIYRAAKCMEDASQTKIFKAFNHLRKLNGAPEPISFD